jgi:hypothetical protein
LPFDPCSGLRLSTHARGLRLLTHARGLRLSIHARRLRLSTHALGLRLRPTLGGSALRPTLGGSALHLRSGAPPFDHAIRQRYARLHTIHSRECNSKSRRSIHKKQAIFIHVAKSLRYNRPSPHKQHNAHPCQHGHWELEGVSSIVPGQPLDNERVMTG